jgi:uncharacterized protein YjbI with pentapeptide repeats
MKSLLKLARVYWPYIVSGLVFAWILWQTYRANNLGFGSRTLWDWLELLVVPLALALAGFWFSRVQKQTELEVAKQAREGDREIALDRQQQNTLENYLDRMKELLLDRHLAPRAKQEVRNLARAWTLNVLRELSAHRNRQVLRFLQESGLVENGTGVDLQEAELPGANLNETNLQRANLERANLRGANLRGAKLEGANLEGADLEGADLEGANLREAKLERAARPWALLRGEDLEGANLREVKLQRANLEGANLEWANLRWANLEGANLEGANLEGANLEGANLRGVYLRGADLRGAMHLTETQISQAILTDDTVMPDGRSYLEWQQKRAQDTTQQQEVAAEPNNDAAPAVKDRLSEPAVNAADAPEDVLLDQAAVSGESK